MRNGLEIKYAFLYFYINCKCDLDTQKNKF